MSGSKLLNDKNKSTKYGPGFWLTILVISLIVFGVNNAVSTLHGARLGSANTESVEILVQSQRLAQLGRSALAGNEKAFTDLTEAQKSINSVLENLRKEYSNNLGVRNALNKLDKTWGEINQLLATIETQRDDSLQINTSADNFGKNLPAFQKQQRQIIAELSRRPENYDDLQIIIQQLLTSESIARRVNEVRSGSLQIAGGDSALERDSAALLKNLQNLELLKVTEALSAEITEANQEAVDTGKVVSTFLTESRRLWDGMNHDVELIIKGYNARNEINRALQNLDTKLLAMKKDGDALFNAFSSFGSVRDSRIFPNFWLGIIAGALALISIVVIVFKFSLGKQKELDLNIKTQEESNSRTQKAVIQLIEEISSLADGDLTVNATVTEDQTGAIADSINYAVEELRNLVITINDTSVQVEASVQEAQSTAVKLVEAATYQAQQIDMASESIEKIAQSIGKVSNDSNLLAETAKRSVSIAGQGVDVVRKTIYGMDQIRNQIQETSKRVKRLGESSQEIGSIVELINSISEQTNILALNAAVQAASSGGAGRGFAGVADEVQRLAERTSTATRRIEGLVKAIQADTNEAVTSMEQTTSEVVAGARLAENAGVSLAEIERVSANLDASINDISLATKQQASTAIGIVQIMLAIRKVTHQTSQGTSQTAQSIGLLSQLATNLRRSVADFKLPK